MFVLRRPPPTGIVLLPERFVPGSRDLLCRVVDAIIRSFHMHLPDVVAEWINFRDNIAPQDDDAVSFMNLNGMYIPLKEELFGVDATTTTPEASSINLLEAREQVKFTASVQWSGRGRNNTSTSSVPYVCSDPSGACAAPVIVEAPRRRRAVNVTVAQDSDNESAASSEDETCFEYIDVDVSGGVSRDFFKYIGREFDDSQDGGTFRIIGICEMRRVGFRKSSNVVCAFKYIDINGDVDDFLYTPIGEMLSCSWCKWKSESTSSSGRSSRLLKRTQAESVASNGTQKRSK